MNVNEEIWGESFWEIGTGTINCRSGVTEKTDTDYEDFPPFISNKVPDVADTDYPCSLFQFVQNDLMELNTEIDKSICYVGFEGGSLSDISAWKYDQWYTGDPWIYTDPRDNKTTYMLVDSFMDKSIATPSMGTTTGTVWSSTYETPELGIFNRYINWSPDAITGGDLTSSANQKKINRNLRLSPYRSWGLRTIYLVIYVAYLTNSPVDGGSVNPTLSKATLHSYYADHTDTWRETHPILGSWAIPYTRIGKTGGYSNAKSSGSTYNRGNHTTSVSIVNELHTNDVSRYDYRFATNYDVTMGYFPLFGYVGLGHPDVTTIPVSSDTLASPLYMGVRTAPNIVRKSSTNKVLWIELDGNAGSTYEYLMSCCAYYGLYFADGTYSLASTGQDETRWTDPNMCLPIISEQGYTDGRYTRGAYNVTNPAFEWKDTTRSPYIPGKPPIPQNEYNTQTVFNTIGDLATMTRRYVLKGSEVMQLGSALWSISEALSGSGSDYTDFIQKTIDQFLTNNPIDCIISLQRYPMTIPAVGTDTVKLGKTDTGIACKPMERTAYFYLFTGSVINPKFGDSFLDYNPYTKMELYVPFCGTMQLNPADIIGRQLNVQLVVDFTTGTCTGFIMSDDLVIETVNGNIAIDIPVTGIQSATVASQLNNAIANKSNKTLEVQSASLGNVSAGGVIRALKDPMKMIYGYQEARNEEQRAEYDLTHQNAPIHIIGSASAVGGWAIDLQCRLIIYYPSGDVIRTGQPPEWNDLQLARYGHTTGFACCIEGSIGSMDSGLVVGINPDLNGMVTGSSGYAATASELDMLRSAIAEGIIL
ncbi:hypothetical protein [Ruminococcus sp.]|uniref:hypothetical protein n=1 Tax=Ruminococcus sp. TaxID=41978 RepID=UPI001B4F12D8|nr:hypothetical protein [Ruminococcus sp.]MBP5434172.1 hypothetical protein [Ruminococcus sp.]